MNSSLIPCIFNCGQDIMENEMQRHIRLKCSNKLKFIHCSQTDNVYTKNTNDLRNHIQICNECKMKNVDIDIALRIPRIVKKSNNDKGSMHSTKEKPIKSIANNTHSLDDTMLNIQLNQKKMRNCQDINNTMIMDDNQSRKKDNAIDDSFAYLQQSSNYHRKTNTIIREYEDDEEDYEKNEEELNSYFANVKPKSNKKQSKDKKDEKEEEEEEEEEEDEEKGSSSEYDKYFK